MLLIVTNYDILLQITNIVFAFLQLEIQTVSIRKCW